MVKIPEPIEDRGVFPDILKTLSLNITAFHIQKPAGLDPAHMGNKTKPGSGQAAPCNGIQPMGFKAYFFAFLPGSLPQNPVIMGSAGGLKLKVDFFSLVIKPVQGLFVFHSIDLTVQNVFSPSRGDQQKNMVGCCAQGFSQLQNFRDLAEIGFCNGGVDLEFNAGLLGELDALKGSFKGLGNPSKGVMGFRG